jgi:hypothetical protein
MLSNYYKVTPELIVNFDFENGLGDLELIGVDFTKYDILFGHTPL